jgi:predicted transcriptional regulator
VEHVTTIQKTIVYRIVQEHGVEHWSLTSVAYVGVTILRVQTVQVYPMEPLGKVIADVYLSRIAETNVTTVRERQTEILR